MAFPVTYFAAKWSPQNNRGTISITYMVGGDRKEAGFTFSDGGNFAALLAVLKESPVFVMPDGAISTSWEQIGQQEQHGPDL